jgi:hypothetical protein
MGCKDECRFIYKDKSNLRHNWSEKGYVKCITCGFTVKTQDLRCKCCKYRFRKHVRNTNSSIYYQNVTKPRKQLEKELLKKSKLPV